MYHTPASSQVGGQPLPPMEVWKVCFVTCLVQYDAAMEERILLRIGPRCTDETVEVSVMKMTLIQTKQKEARKYGERVINQKHATHAVS